MHILINYTKYITAVITSKGISVREDLTGCKTLHIKIDEDRYKSMSDFYIEIKASVKFPEKELTHFNGYILTVHRRDGVSCKYFSYSWYAAYDIRTRM